MILIINRGDNIKVSDYFSSSEFHCKCKYRDCKETQISEELVKALEELRDLTGPLFITSGFRCGKHNTDIGGVGGSQHLEGKACDIYSQKHDTKKLAQFAEQIEDFENGGIGVAHNFVHVDIRGYKIRWTYPLPI